MKVLTLTLGRIPIILETDLEGKREQVLAGGREDGHELLKGHEGSRLVKLHPHVTEVLHIRQVGRIVLGVKPATGQRVLRPADHRRMHTGKSITVFDSQSINLMTMDEMVRSFMLKKTQDHN